MSCYNDWWLLCTQAYAERLIGYCIHTQIPGQRIPTWGIQNTLDGDCKSYIIIERLEPYGEVLERQIMHLNTLHSTLKFTADISNSSINFLHITIYIRIQTSRTQGKLSTKIFTKPCDTFHQYIMPTPITMRFWHWKSHWTFLWHWKSTETTLKNIYKGNHSDNPGFSHWNMFLCCSRTLKSHWKKLNHTEKFSALLISFVPRFFSVTLDFQCDFQCHNFIVHTPSIDLQSFHLWWILKNHPSEEEEEYEKTSSFFQERLLLRGYEDFVSDIQWSMSHENRQQILEETSQKLERINIPVVFTTRYIGFILLTDIISALLENWYLIENNA